MSAEEQVSRYKILLDTARCFGRAMDLRSLIDEILDRSKEVMRAEACTLLLPDRESDDLLLHSTDPTVAELKEPLKVPAGRGFAGIVFNTRQSLNIPDAQQDPRHYQAIGRKIGFVSRAMLSIPLLDGAECLGVLQAINPRDRPHFDTQDEEIFEGFGGLIVNALLRLEAQKRQVEQAQIEQELGLAREIQESFLPVGVQRFPFCQVHLSYFPAQVVGGDFYCVELLEAQRVLLALGDVTGKGIPAALTMARATAMIRAMAGQLQEDLGSWVTALNRQLAQDLKAGRFIGMTFLLADAASSSLQVCAAGQFSPFHAHDGAWEHFKTPTHLPLGISTVSDYNAVAAPLQSGDFWLLFSDGITEARNVEGEEFTTPGFLSSLPGNRTAGATLNTAVEAWTRFSHSAPRHDDASLLLLDWRGLPPPAVLDTVCCPENLRLGRDFAESWAKYAGYDDVAIGQIILACDEAVTNVFRHGYKECAGPLRFHAEIKDGSLEFRIEDEAQRFDPRQIQQRDPSEVKPGGLGSYIISQVFEHVRYEPQERGTLLTLRKQLPP